MPYRLPDISEIMAVAASRGEDSDAPHLWRGLVGAWPLQEPGGVTAYDVSGYGRHGDLTAMEAEDRTMSPRGRCLVFGGTDETVIIPYGANLGFTTAYTFAAWCYQDTDRNWNVWFVRGTANTDDIEIYSSVSGQGLTVAHNRGNGGTFEYVASDSNTGVSGNGGWADMTHGGWHHLAVTFEANTLRVYVNGKQAGNTITGLIDPLNTNRTLRLGSTANTAFSATGAWCIGRMAFAQVYNRALAPAEIQQLYADPWAMYRLRPSVFAAAVAEEPSGFKPYWARPSYQIIGGGIA
jgi:hypothetical protein